MTTSPNAATPAENPLLSIDDKGNGIYVVRFNNEKVLEGENIKIVKDLISAAITNRKPQETGRRFILDMSNIKHIGSAAIGTFINLNTLLRNSKCQNLVIASPIPEAHELLILTRVHKLFHICKTLEDAMNPLSPGMSAA